MADVYRDLVYTRNTSSIGATDTTLTVEDVSLFPPNTLLAKADFWLTIESPLSYPNTFEIVKLTAVDTAAKTLTVVRGQSGTTAVGHAIAVYIKGALTSHMLRRARAGLSGTTLPPADTDIFLPGDRFYHLTEQRYYAFTGQAATLVDTFTRAVSTTTLGATETSSTVTASVSWQNLVGVFGITASGQAAYQSGAVANYAAALLNVGSTELDFSIQIHIGSVGEYTGLLFRATGDGQYGYLIDFRPAISNGGTVVLIRLNNGVQTGVATFINCTSNTTYTVRVKTVDAVITIWFNGALAYTYTEATPPAQIGGNVGFYLASASALADPAIWWDNFTVANTSPSPGGWQPTADIPGVLGATVNTFLNGALPVLELNQIVTAVQVDDLLDVLVTQDASVQHAMQTVGPLATQSDEMLDILVADNGYTQRSSQVLGVLASQLDDMLTVLTATAGAVVITAANYSATVTDTVIVASGTITITLPAASTVSGGKTYTVKNAGTGTVTIAPGGGTVDGSATASLATQYAVGRYASDGTTYWIV